MTNTARKYIRSVVESFDIFGISYSFQIENQSKLKTILGGWITIFFYIVLIVLFFSFGVDFYQRKNPKISLNSKNIQHKEVNFSNQNFTLAFRIENESGIQVMNNSILYLELGFFKYEIQDNGQWLMTKRIDNQSLTYSKCSELENYREKEKVFNVSLSGWYCANFDNSTLGGYWDGNFVSGLIINTRVCSYKRYKDLQCLDPDSIRKEFKKGINTGGNFFYSFLYLESLPVMDNFENPIQSNLINKFEMLDLNILKRSVQIFKRISIDSDVGWLFSDREDTTYYSNEIILQDFSLKDEIEEDLLYTHFIYLGRKVEIFSRSYSKLQEVLANVGGFANILLIVLNFIYYYIQKVSKNLLLLEKFEFYEENEIKEEKFKDNNYVSKNINLFENKNNKMNLFNENMNLNKYNNFFETKKDNNQKNCFENSSFIEKSLGIKNEENTINEMNNYQKKNYNYENIQNSAIQSNKNDIMNQNNNLGNIKIYSYDENFNIDEKQKFPYTTKNIPNSISSKKMDFKMNSLVNTYKNNDYLNRFRIENNFEDENINKNDHFMKNFGKKYSENQLKEILSMKFKADHQIINDRNNFNHNKENQTINNINDISQSKLNPQLENQIKSAVINEENIILAKNSKNNIKKKKLSFFKYFIYNLKNLCKTKFKQPLIGSEIKNINSQIEQTRNKNFPPNNNNLKGNSANNCFEVNNSNQNLKENKINEIQKNKQSNNLINLCERNSNSNSKITSLKNEIYRNYKTYEFNLNNFFDVFNYLDLVKDIKFFKEILFGQNKDIFDLLKYKLEPLKIDSNERISHLNGINIEEYSNTFILENLNKILYQQYC